MNVTLSGTIVEWWEQSLSHGVVKCTGVIVGDRMINRDWGGEPQRPYWNSAQEWTTKIHQYQVRVDATGEIVWLDQNRPSAFIRNWKYERYTQSSEGLKFKLWRQWRCRPEQLGWIQDNLNGAWTVRDNASVPRYLFHFELEEDAVAFSLYAGEDENVGTY